MCGIEAFISKGKKPIAGEKILEQYEDQFERGQKGFGVIEIFQNTINVKRATEPVKALLDARLSKAPVMMFHHRMPTSTDNKLNQTHPIYVSHEELDYDYYVMHNGVIRNEDELYKKHTEEMKYVYTTHVEKEKPLYETTSRMGYAQSSYWTKEKFNDSEACAIELARFLDGECGTVDVEGSMAFIALRVEKKTKKPLLMYWGRNKTNPAEILETKEGLLIASDINDATAYQTEDDTYFIFDLQKYFKQKKTDLVKCMTAEILIFKEKPIVGKTLALPAHSTSDTKTTTDSKTDSDKEKEKNGVGSQYDKDWGDPREVGYQSPREEAFAKQADRVIEKITEEIEEIFMKMSYEAVGPDEIEDVTNALYNLILEKEENAKVKVRPYFDKREDEELERQMAEWDQMKENEKQEMMEEAINAGQKAFDYTEHEFGHRGPY